MRSLRLSVYALLVLAVANLAAGHWLVGLSLIAVALSIRSSSAWRR